MSKTEVQKYNEGGGEGGTERTEQLPLLIASTTLHNGLFLSKV